MSEWSLVQTSSGLDGRHKWWIHAPDGRAMASVEQEERGREIVVSLNKIEALARECEVASTQGRTEMREVYAGLARRLRAATEEQPSP